MERTSHPRLRALLGLVAVLTGGCPSPAPPGGSEDLLSLLDAAAIHSPQAGRIAGQTDPTAGALLVGLPDEAALAGEWFEGSWIAARAKQQERAPVQWSRLRADPVGGEDLLLVPAPAGGLSRQVAVEGWQPLLVRAELRALEPAAQSLPGLSLQTLGDEPATDRSAQVQNLQSSLQSRARNTAQMKRNVPAEWQRVELYLAPDPRRRGLQVSITGGDGGCAVRSLEVRRLSALEDLGMRRRFLASGPEPGSPFRTRGRVGKDEADCLVMPAPTRITWELPSPTVAARFDAGLACVGDPRDLPVHFILEVDGVERSRQTLPVRYNVSDLAFVAWELPLPSPGTERMQVTLRTEGDGDALALVATPRILVDQRQAAYRNLVLISLDTLRADELAVYGGSARTPALDAVAEAGVVFENAYSTSSYTLPSHASMLTGLHPIQHGARGPGSRIRSAPSALLARQLQEAGYATAAFTGGGFVHPSFGFGEGFSFYSSRDPGGVFELFQTDRPLPGADPAFVDLQPALAWLGRHADQPFFLFVHTYFIHNYSPARAFWQRQGEGDPLAGIEREELLGRARSGDPAALDHLRRLYRACIDEVDAALLAPLLRRLEELQLDSRTVVAVVSDHGEAFGEHGNLMHGLTLWNEETRIPWILRAPGLPPGRVAGPVSVADVAPTLRVLLGLPERTGTYGRDALGSRPTARPILLDLRNLRAGEPVDWDAVVAGEHALLREHFPGGAPRCYLFAAEDGSQRTDRSAEEVATVARLAALLDDPPLAPMAENSVDAAAGPAALEAELREALRALGYEDH